MLESGKSFEKIPLVVNVEDLKTYLESHPESFDDYPDRLSGPHAEVSDIWVRYNNAKNRGPGFNDPHFPVWYPISAKLPDVFKIAFELMGFVNGEHLGGILITKLPPGGRVGVHTDSGWHAEFYDKFYIPVKNKPGSKFCFPDGDIDPQEGEVYQFDNSIPHSVENNTDEDRIAMIICIRTVATSLRAKLLSDEQDLHRILKTPEHCAAFDMYFASLCSMQVHPGAGTKDHAKLTFEECRDKALEMFSIRSNLVGG